MSDEDEVPGHRRRWIVTSIVLILAGALVAALLVGLRPKPAARSPDLRPPIVEVVSVRVRSDPLKVKGNGVVAPRETLAITAEVGGEITEVHPQLLAGGRFSQGEVLLRIDPERYQAALRRVASESRATAAGLRYAQTELSRTRQLFDQGVLGKSELEQLESNAAQLTATLSAQKAAVTLARIDLDNATITAPFDGRVLSESVAAGQVVAVGQVLAEIYPVDAFEVDVRLENEQAALIGQLVFGEEVPARVMVQHAGATLQWSAKVTRMTGSYAHGSQTLGIVVRIDDPLRPGAPRPGSPAMDERERLGLMPGRFVEVAIDAPRPTGILELPATALHGDDEVWTVVDERLYIHDVDVVHRADGVVFVRSPELAAGAAVVVSALDAAVDGMSVRVRIHTRGERHA